MVTSESQRKRGKGAFLRDKRSKKVIITGSRTGNWRNNFAILDMVVELEVKKLKNIQYLHKFTNLS